jgi:hypothetical protein
MTMSAATEMARMLGHLRRGGCSNSRCRLCHQEDTTRWRKRVERRQAEREIASAVHDWDITEEEFEAARREMLDRFGEIPPSLQKVIDRGGRFRRGDVR